MNKKIIFIIAGAIVLALIAILWSYFKPFQPKFRTFEECVAAGFPVMESYPRQCKIPGGETFYENVGNEILKINLIRITNPRPNQMIASPLEITGLARGYWFFEASFPIKLYDDKEKLLAIAIAQAQDEWMTENFVPFYAKMEFAAAGAAKGTLVLERDNPSGLPENSDELRVPVVFEQATEEQEMMTVKAYFNNSELDPEFSCNKVFPVEREVIKTEAVARAALEELLKGATKREKVQGFFTSINSGVKIQKLTIEEGTAKVDFDDQIEFQVGGSCRVSAIRAQITQTLKQFPSVQNVIISVNGRTEDILQP